MPDSADPAALGLGLALDLRLGLSPELGDAGINLAGVLSVSEYDARVPAGWRSARLLPSALSAVVLATGGPAFFRAFQASGQEGDGGCDAFLVRVVEAAVQRETVQHEGQAVAGYYFEQRDGFADFVGLAEAAGLGRPSRLGILVHPEYGPWLAIRAVLLVSRALEPSSLPSPGFDPCTGCPAPCATACLGQAVVPSGFDIGRCAEATAREPACRVGCSARRACVIGQAHRYDEAAEAYHRAAVLKHLSIP